MSTLENEKVAPLSNYVPKIPNRNRMLHRAHVGSHWGEMGISRPARIIFRDEAFRRAAKGKLRASARNH